jgi:hypothetical protein
MKNYFFCLAILVFSHVPVFSQNGFSFRVMPQFAGPVGIENFEPGFGAAASLDWGFLSLPHNMGLGLSLGGGFSQLGIDDGSGFSIFEGSLGPFLQWRVLDRLTIRADANAGLYRYSWKDKSNSRFRSGGALSAYFHLLPSMALYASGGYTPTLPLPAAGPLTPLLRGLG